MSEKLAAPSSSPPMVTTGASVHVAACGLSLSRSPHAASRIPAARANDAGCAMPSLVIEPPGRPGVRIVGCPRWRNVAVLKAHSDVGEHGEEQRDRETAGRPHQDDGCRRARGALPEGERSSENEAGRDGGGVEATVCHGRVALQGGG